MYVAALNFPPLAVVLLCVPVYVVLFVLWQMRGGGWKVRAESLRDLAAIKRAFNAGTNEGADRRRSAAMTALKRFVQESRSDPTQQEAAAQFARRAIKARMNRTDNRSANEIWHLLAVLAAVQPPWEVEFLERVANSKAEAWVRGMAVHRIAQLQATKSVDLIGRWLDDPALAPAAAHAIASIERPAATPETIARIRRLVTDSNNQAAISAGAKALIALGRATDPALRAFEDNLDPWTRFAARLRAEEVSAEALVGYLRAAGVIGPNRSCCDDSDTLAQLSANLERGDGLKAISDLLAKTRSGLSFDTECGFVPPDYKSLMRDLGEIAAPRIEIGNVGFEFPKLTFLCCNRAVELIAADLGDWFDLATVVNGLNSAIRDAGRPERFVTLPTGGQEALVILGDADGVKQLVEDHAFPIETDPSSAIQLGQAVEQHVAHVVRFLGGHV